MYSYYPYSQEWMSYRPACYDSDCDDSYRHRSNSDNQASKLKHSSTEDSFSKFHDVSIKVGEKIYPLNRLQLALVSNYFEKLFTEDYAEKDSELVEIGALDSNTFSAIVNVINGKDLKSLINADSYVSLLIAMDYLQMEVNLKPFEQFLEEYIKRDVPFDSQMFELSNLIATNQDYNYLKCNVHYYLSCHFVDFLNYPEFLILQLENLVDIMKMQQRVSRYPCAYEKNLISQICAKWICHDVKKRLNGFVKLINAANYRLFRTSFRINADSVKIALNSVKGEMIEEAVRRYFYEFLDYNGEIDPDDPEDQSLIFSSGYSTINEIDIKQKWIRFVETGYFYDVTIKAGEKTYRLHQAVLKTASGYFADLFFARPCETLVQSMESSVYKSKDNPYVINIDETTFDAVVRFIYFDDIELKTLAESMKMLSAGKNLKIDKLVEKSSSWMKCNARNFSIKDILQILDLSVAGYSTDNANNQISSLVCNFLYSEAAKKLTRDIYYRIWKANEILQCDELTKKCANWVVDNLRTLNNDDIIEILNKKQGEAVVLQFLNTCNIGEKLLLDPVFYMLQFSKNLRFEKLATPCLKWMTKNLKKLTNENIIEVLNFTRGKEKFDYEHAFFLCDHVVSTWPDINESLFCTISCTVLENMLALPNFHFDDPHQILDICAKWIAHDVKNRYPLIPKIAFNINRNRTANRDDYKITEIPQDLNNCSQQLFKDKLWEILRSTSLVRYSDTEDSRIEKIPVFISSYRRFAGDVDYRYKCNILDIKLKKIASLKNLQFHYENESKKYYLPEYPLSAALIKDNLFVLCEIYERSVFQVYNLSSEKCYSLAGIPPIRGCRESTILNCNDQIYCCFSEAGTIMRYSIELNRWEVILKAEVEADRIRMERILHTSDRKNLYRVLKLNSKYVAQMWDFKQGSWACLPDLPTSSYPERPTYLTNVKDGIAILLNSVTYLFDLNLSSWRTVSIPEGNIRTCLTQYMSITHYDNNLLYMNNYKMYVLHNLQEEWTQRKDKLFETELQIVSIIHRCINEAHTCSGISPSEKKRKKRRRKKNKL